MRVPCARAFDELGSAWHTESAQFMVAVFKAGFSSRIHCSDWIKRTVETFGVWKMEILVITILRTGGIVIKLRKFRGGAGVRNEIIGLTIHVLFTVLCL